MKSERLLLENVFMRNRKSGGIGYFKMNCVGMDKTQIVGIIPRNRYGQYLLRKIKPYPTTSKLFIRQRNVRSKRLITQYLIDYLIMVLRIARIYSSHIEVKYTQGYPLTIQTRDLTFLIAPRLIKKSDLRLSIRWLNDSWP